MTDYVWKHLPSAIYLDTNALRTAGPTLDASWINELLSITNKYGISVCISELVLSEWCEHIMVVLGGKRQKLLSSITLLRHYGVSVPDIRLNEISLPRNSQLVSVVSGMMKAAGFTIITNWDAPLSRLLNEAVTKRPPFDQGGKGLCDAVILESYAEHARENFTKSRVLVISNDGAVKRSAERFKDREIAVDFVSETEIVAKLKSLLSDESSAYLEAKKSKLTAFVQAHELEILDYIRKTPVEITDWTINPPSAELYDRIIGTVESILSVRPVKITNVIGGAPTYGEETAKNRYPIRISVEIELEIVVTEPGFGLGLLGPQARAVVQPDLLDSTSPVTLEKKTYNWKPREIVKTVTRALTVVATIDAQKEKDDIFDDLRIDKVF